MVREMPLHCSAVLLGHCCPGVLNLYEIEVVTQREKRERNQRKKEEKKKATWTQFRIFR